MGKKVCRTGSHFTMCSRALRMTMVAGAFWAFAASAVAQTEPVVLLADDFGAYPVAEVLDAEKYGYRIGPWQLMTLHYSWHSQRYSRSRMVLPFRIVERGGRRFLDEPESLFNVVVKAGQPEWRDYTLELELAVNDGPAGPIVRYQTSRRNYWVRFESGQPVKLYRRDQEEHTLLGVAANFCVQKDRLYHCHVTCDGPRLTVAVDEQPVIEVEDDAYSHGQVALRTEGPSRFTAVKVLAEPAESERLAAERKRGEERTARDTKAAPPAQLIHTATLPGKPDIDGDGRTEVICVRGSQILIVEGATGAIKRRAPHPDVYRERSTLARGLGGAPYIGGALVCNLRGLPLPRDLVFKDEYMNLWAYTDELKLLWHRLSLLKTPSALSYKDLRAKCKRPRAT